MSRQSSSSAAVNSEYSERYPPPIKHCDKFIFPNGPPHYRPCEPTDPIISWFKDHAKELDEFARENYCTVDIHFFAKDRNSEYQSAVVFQVKGVDVKTIDVNDCITEWSEHPLSKNRTWPVHFVRGVDTYEDTIQEQEEELKAEWPHGSLMEEVVREMKEQK